MGLLISLIILTLAIYFTVKYINYTNKYSNTNTFKTESRNLVGIYMSDFEVVGIHINERKWYIINHVIKHNPVELIPEPNNKYSKEAIMVKINGVHVGYISETDVAEVHEIIKCQHQARVLLKEYTNEYLNLRIEINHN